MSKIRSAIIKTLEENKGKKVSGGALAEKLGVSRTAVWKVIDNLKLEGYDIKSMPNKGYYLEESSDILSKEAVESNLKSKAEVYFYPSVESTNNTAMYLISEGAKADTVVVANEQTKGKGRRGRQFVSAENAGLYMSIVLEPKVSIDKSVLITTAASVAVVRALEELYNLDAKIKWVNDVYVNDKKVCGILTEALTDFETSQIRDIIVGIGINTRAEELSTELQKTASGIDVMLSTSLDRGKLAAKIIDNMLLLMQQIEFGSADFINEYREHSMILGKDINIFKSVVANPEDAIAAKAIDIDNLGGLIVEYPDGKRETLSTGEVTIRLK